MPAPGGMGRAAGGGQTTLKWISIKWASQKAFARFFLQENNG